MYLSKPDAVQLRNVFGAGQTFFDRCLPLMKLSGHFPGDFREFSRNIDPFLWVLFQIEQRHIISDRRDHLVVGVSPVWDAKAIHSPCFDSSLE